MSARPKRHPKAAGFSAGSYLLNCRIEEQGPGDFLAIVTALPDTGCPPGAKAESETRRQGTREEAFRACALLGFAMEARLLRRGAQVRGWPPRGKAR
jgi:hypothetical protein